jgi:MFS family permease
VGISVDVPRERRLVPAHSCRAHAPATDDRRAGRRDCQSGAILVACCACGIGALALLVSASALWHFWIVGLLLAVLGVSAAIGPAFIADLVPPARALLAAAAVTGVGVLLVLFVRRTMPAAAVTPP